MEEFITFKINLFIEEYDMFGRLNVKEIAGKSFTLL